MSTPEQTSMEGQAGLPDDRTVDYESAVDRFGFTIMPNAVLLDPDLSQAAKFAYLGLRYYARQSEKAWPGQEAFARQIGMSERSFRDAKRELEAKRLVATRRRGRGMTNSYTILDLRAAEIDTSRAAESAALERQNPPLSLEEDAEKKTQENSQGGSLFPVPDPPAEDIDADVQKVWDHYVQVFAPPKAKLGPNRIKGIKRALKEASVETLIAAVDGLYEFRKTRPGKTSLETIWETFKGTGTMVERIEFFASKSRTTGEVRQFPSAPAAIVSEKQKDVQRGHRAPDNAETVERAERSEAWLREHGIETVRREGDGYPIFRPLVATGGGAA